MLTTVFRDRREAGVERTPQPADQIGKRVREILVFAAAEPVTPHDDTAAEVLVARIERGKAGAIRRAEHRRGDRAAVAVEILRNPVPLERCDALGHG